MTAGVGDAAGDRRARYARSVLALLRRALPAGSGLELDGPAPLPLRPWWHS